MLCLDSQERIAVCVPTANLQQLDSSHRATAPLNVTTHIHARQGLELNTVQTKHLSLVRQIQIRAYTPSTHTHLASEIILQSPILSSHLSACLSIYNPAIHPSIFLSFYLSIYLSIYLSSTPLSISLSPPIPQQPSDHLKTHESPFTDRESQTSNPPCQSCSTTSTANHYGRLITLNTQAELFILSRAPEKADLTIPAQFPHHPDKPP